MESLAVFAGSVQALTESQPQKLAAMLTRSVGMLAESAAAGGLETVMGQIDPVRHSLGWLYLLVAQGDALCGAPAGASAPRSQTDAAAMGAAPGGAADDGEGEDALVEDLPVQASGGAPDAAVARAGADGGVAGGGMDPAAAESFMSRCSHFLTNCSAEQVQLAPGTFATLCERYVTLAVASGQPLRAVQPLRSAVEKARPAPATLTPQHAFLLQAALAAKCYAAASDALAEDVHDVDPKGTGLTAKDFLLYCYYGGCALVGLQRFADAHELLLAAVTAPAHAPSAIMVAAYKKMRLVGLIVHGKAGLLPKHTHNALQRHVKMACQDYADIAAAFETGKSQMLCGKVEAKKAVLEADGNWGLAQQVVESLFRRNIQRLTKTYLTLSLEDIASHVGLPGAADAEARLVRMVEKREIFATIDQSCDMVRLMRAECRGRLDLARGCARAACRAVGGV